MITKISEVKLSNVQELHEFLKAHNVAFDDGATLKILRGLATKVLQGAEAASDPTEPTATTDVAASEEESSADMDQDAERDAALLKQAGSRRDIPLEELLLELRKKGFNNKQELADYLEAVTRERAALVVERTELSQREEKISKDEITLLQRIADNEVIFAKVHQDMEKSEARLAKAMLLEQRYAGFQNAQ